MIIFISISNKRGIMQRVYADNSATSFPKAPAVSDAMKDYLDTTGFNINRSGYADSYSVALEVLETRQMLAGLFHTQNAQEVVFTPGLTFSINMLLQGFLKRGDHIITSSMEHNAVMRPLYALSKGGISFDAVPCGRNGLLRASDIIPLIRRETKAVFLLHASNVCGTVMPIEAVSEICREYKLRLIVDAAQTAGVLDINAGGIDAVVFSGHKGLLGPQGIGGFVIKKEFAQEVAPLIPGGTGSLSQEFEQPEFLPDKYESGTLNIPGILGLKKALEYLVATGIDSIYKKETTIADAFVSRVQDIKGVRLIAEDPNIKKLAVVSLDFVGNDNANIAAVLDNKYGIMTRCGLHCAPAAHKTLDTYPFGTVRFSFGHTNTLDEVEYITQSIKKILRDQV